MSAMKFQLGQVVITANAHDVLNPTDVQNGLARHASGDGGDLNEHDRHENEIALVQDLRLFSVYHDRARVKFYITTEHDRSATTILLPEDY